MSEILVDVTSQSADSAGAGFTEVTDLVDTVEVPSGGVVLIMAVVPLDQGDSNDEAADFRFAIDDVLDGPEVTAFKDEVDEGCGVALCFAITGLSGSTKFALQWRNRQGTAAVDTGRVRSFQVVHISDASLLVDISSTSADSAVSGYQDIDEMTDTQTPAGASSILVLLANMVGAIAGDNTASFQFTVGGSAVGPESKAFEDTTDEGCGMSHVWCLTGESGSTAFALQWDELQPSYQADTGRERTFQVIEITDNAEILTAVTSVAADALTSSFTDVIDLVDTVEVEGTDSILLFFATLPLLQNQDRTAAFRVFEGGTGEGPEQYVFADNDGDFDEACGHSVYHAVTGKSAGSHTFSIRGQNVQGTANLSTDQRRSLVILELVAAVTQVDKDAVDTLGLEINEGVTDLLARMERVDDLNLEVNEDAGQILAGLEALDDMDLSVEEGVTLILGLITPQDLLDLAILEGDPSIFVDGTAQDDVDLDLVEAAELLSLTEVLDLLELEINEGVGQVAAGVTAEDDIALTVIEETADLLGLIQPVDTTGLTLAEVTQVLSLAERLDALGISISEVADLLGFLTRTDLLDLEIVESPSQVAVGIAAEDTVDLDITEGPSQVLVGIAREDTLDLSLVEQADLLGFIQAADTVALTIIEGVPLLLVQSTATDLVDLEIVEDAGQVVVGLQASDLVDLEVVEAVAKLTVTIQASDLLDLSVSEVAILVGFLNRTDVLDLALDQPQGVLIFIQAVDDLGIEILDAAQVLSLLQAADELDLDITEVASVLNVISVLDTLDIDLTEDPADVVKSVAFQGILVQPFTLQVTRVAKFTLQATRVARFTLQIEGSGEQRP